MTNLFGGLGLGGLIDPPALSGFGGGLQAARPDFAGALQAAHGYPLRLALQQSSLCSGGVLARNALQEPHSASLGNTIPCERAPVRRFRGSKYHEGPGRRFGRTV
jgi:hypothetical protein